MLPGRMLPAFTGLFADLVWPGCSGAGRLGVLGCFTGVACRARRYSCMKNLVAACSCRQLRIVGVAREEKRSSTSISDSHQPFRRPSQKHVGAAVLLIVVEGGSKNKWHTLHSFGATSTPYCGRSSVSSVHLFSKGGSVLMLYT